MKKRNLLKIMIAAFAILSMVSGCKEGGPSTRVFVRKGTGERLRIAVLPFDNVSKDQDAGRVLTNTVVTFLLSTGSFDVVEPGVTYSALGADAVRMTDGITVEACQKLQPKLNVDAFVIGVVEEYGEVRVGAESYPAISMSARLVDARTANILWAATISKTGAEGIKVFDIGRVSSLGKLSKMAVQAMAESLAKSRPDILVGLRPSTPADGLIQQAGQTNGATASTQPTANTAVTVQNAKYLDEAPTYGESEISGLLKDVGNAKLQAVSYKKHFHDSIETQYKLDNGKFIEVKLFDYRKASVAKNFIQHKHPGEQETTFESLPAFTNESGFGYYHLDMAAGRFGIFLGGPKDLKSDIEALGKGIIEQLK